MIDIAIVGAGAAGLMAAIHAGRNGSNLRIAIFDGATRLGAKILISGGGRCNVTNERVEATDFNGSSRNQIARVLKSFGVAPTIAFFEDLGVALHREETGKLFPIANRADVVLNALVYAAKDAGVTIETNARVTRVEKRGESFLLETSDLSIEARSVILATGGKSVPKTGSDGAGYEFARTLGHSTTPLFPALVPLVVPKDHWITSLSGISFEAEVRVVAAAGRVLARSEGSVLATHFGLSGPAILDISRHLIAARASDPDSSLEIDFVPGLSFEALDAQLTDRLRQSRATIRSSLRDFVTERLAAAFIDYEVGIAAESPGARLTREQRRLLAHALHSLRVPVHRDRGFDFAEVTAGGVPLSEVQLASMESRVSPALFLCGEILDVDGRIGGFNFQWAWASGRLAGMSAAAALARRP